MAAIASSAAAVLPGRIDLGLGRAPGTDQNTMRALRRPFADDEADAILQSPQASHVDQVMTHTAAGTPNVVMAFLDDFATHAEVAIS